LRNALGYSCVILQLNLPRFTNSLCQKNIVSYAHSMPCNNTPCAFIPLQGQESEHAIHHNLSIGDQFKIQQLIALTMQQSSLCLLIIPVNLPFHAQSPIPCTHVQTIKREPRENHARRGLKRNTRSVHVDVHCQIISAIPPLCPLKSSCLPLCGLLTSPA
jgi:hypothetical protein